MEKSVLCYILLWVAVPSMAHAQAAIPVRSMGYNHGRLEYRISSPRPTNLPNAVEVDHTTELMFASDGRFKEVQNHPQNLGKDVKTFTFVQGKGYRYTEVEKGASIEATFDDSGQWPRMDNPDTDIVERPCLPLALGLSALRPSGESLQVQRDANARATSATKIYKGRTIFVWRYEGRITTGTSIALPRLSSQYVQNELVKRYELLSADLEYVPTDGDLATQWFRPGVTVVDRRVSPIVVWSYKGLSEALAGRAASPGLLLKLSQARSGAFHIGDVRKRRLESQVRVQRETDRLLLWLMAIPVLLLIGLYAIRLRRR